MIKDKLADFVDRAFDGDFVLTKFLDFEEQKEFLSCKVKGLYFTLYGGYEECERKRGIISLFEYEDNNESYEISIIQAHFEKKFADITHRHVLGTIMSLGIERNTFGDIFVEDSLITIFVSKDIKEFIMHNLSFILKQRMDWVEVDSFISTKIKDEERIINVASLRLDAVVSKVLNVSRTEACEYIEAGLVLINHAECLDVDKKLNIDDMLSIRKYGRATIKEIVNTSKKNRLNIKISVKH